MTVQQLIEHLQQFPPDLEVWVSDAGYCAGAAKCIAPEKKIAWEADLDGDEVDKEYFYYDEECEDDIETYKHIVLNPKSHGYIKFDGGRSYDKGYSKEIVLLKSTLDE